MSEATTEVPGIRDPRYSEALASVEHALLRFKQCTEQEKQQLLVRSYQGYKLDQGAIHGRDRYCKENQFLGLMR